MSVPSDMAAFVRAVEKGGFSPAARELGLTPSAISKLVTRMENRLGVRLLNRTTRKLALTPEGEAFFHRASRILADIEEAENEVARFRAHPRGRLRVNVGTAFGSHQLVPALLGEGRDVEADHLSVVVGGQPQIGGQDAALDVLQAGGIEGSNGQLAWFRYADRGQLDERRGRSVVLDGQALDQHGRGAPGADAREVVLQGAHGPLHAGLGFGQGIVDHPRLSFVDSGAVYKDSAECRKGRSGG